MQLADLRYPRFYVPLGLVLVLGIAAALIFHPAFQKKMLLDHVAPLVDSLEIGYVHLTPWSLDVDQLAVEYQGGRFALGKGTFRYCVSSLVLLNLHIKTLALKDVLVDLEKFSPPATETTESGLFPGVLAVLEYGLGYILQDLSANAEVRLPGKQSLTATITGSDVRPGGSGAIQAAARFNTGKGEDHIDLDGVITLDQLKRGRFASIAGVLDIQAALADLPETESVSVKLAVVPAPVDEEQQAVVTADSEEPQFTPELLHLALLQTDSEGKQRSTLELDGIYDGNTRGFDGDYKITASERLVQPYVKDYVMPPSREELTGELDFNLGDLTGAMTVSSDLLVTELKKTHANEQLPELLNLKNNFRLALLPGRQLRVETLDTGLSDEDKHQPLASKLPASLNIPLDDVGSFLKQENTLLEFEVPGLPMKWLSVFLSGQEITDGILTAAFRVTTNANSEIRIVPLKPLEITGLTIRQEDAALVEGLDVSVMPGVTYSGTVLSVTLDKLVVDAGKGPLATADFSASLPMSEAQQGSITAQGKANLDTKNIISVLDLKQTGRQTMPRRLALDFQTTLNQQPGSVVVKQLDVDLTRDNKTRLLNLQLLQPVVMKTTAAGNTLGNGAGQLARLAISDIRLDWFSPFLPDTTMKGRLRRANFTLATDAQGEASITSAGPVTLDRVTVIGSEGPLLENFSVSIRPAIRFAQKGTVITYQDLKVTGDETSLATGKGMITLPGAAEQVLEVDGRLDVDVQALSQQPLVAKALKAEVTAPVRLEADYRLAQGERGVDISRLAVNLYYSDAVPKVSLQNHSSVRVRTQLGRRQSELGRARGEVSLTVANLTPEPFAAILKANGLAFTNANGKAVLNSDGKSLNVDTVEPFVIKGIEVKTGGERALHPFTLTAASETTMQGDTLHARLHQFTIGFDRDKGKHAVEGTVDLIVKSDEEAVRVDTLDADLTVLLPAMLDQPAILPGHSLKGGEMKSTLDISTDGEIKSITRIQGLQGKEKLPLQVFEIQANGQLDPNGNFAVTAPITSKGVSGESDMRVQATHTGKEGSASKDVVVTIDSGVFYLNDILNTLHSIAGKQTAETDAKDMQAGKDGENAAAAKTDSDELPDTQAFWDQTDYDVHTTLNMERLFYTDYLEIDAIKARADFMSDRLSLTDFEARFHDSPISMDGILRFAQGAKPYDLKLQASVEKFDLATFFRELAPDSRPRAEGLFEVKLDAFGQSPNLNQYRNQLLFDMRLQSRNGIFRLLDPDSALVTGSSGIAGGFGEVVSYVPTGLFGLGAVSRLVNYIKDIDYDRIDIHLVRDESRDVQIRQYVVQSPSILMTAKGGIEYQEGVDVLDSPLSMDAQLNMRDRGAAIMYELNLLQKEQDRYGYWKGPTIRFWGTMSKSESNLGDIIATAGRAAVLGGITRPISGLIGNIKHLWFGKDEKPAEYDGE
jgi:hypothetical protein